MARRRFSSISGPSTKPRIIGAGSQSSRISTKPTTPKNAASSTADVLLLTV